MLALVDISAGEKNIITCRPFYIMGLVLNVSFPFGKTVKNDATKAMKIYRTPALSPLVLNEGKKAVRDSSQFTEQTQRTAVYRTPSLLI